MEDNNLKRTRNSQDDSHTCKRFNYSDVIEEIPEELIVQIFLYNNYNGFLAEIKEQEIGNLGFPKIIQRFARERLVPLCKSNKKLHRIIQPFCNHLKQLTCSYEARTSENVRISPPIEPIKLTNIPEAKEAIKQFLKHIFILFDKKTLQAIFMRAAENCDVIAMQILLELKDKEGNRIIDINYADINNFNKTALYIASQRGYYVIVELLLKNGADPNIPGNFGRTPYQIAVINKHMDIQKLLLDFNADRNLLDNLGLAACEILKMDSVTRVDNVVIKN